MKGINIFLADGFEDIEALGTCDVLRRAGLQVELISIKNDTMVTSSHGVDIDAEWVFEDMEIFGGTTARDIMIFPGGMPGSMSLASCKKLIQTMKAHYREGGMLAAICAAPGLVLSQLDDVKGLEFTCFEGFQDALVNKGAVYNPKPAVRSGRIITGRSAGHALSFALEIVAALEPDRVDDVRHSLYLD
ncbi:MAG: DJ-1/PfpI family protein [Bacteroidales bacterium]|nr:DJ-1/PfpI family protein [Bacteroidales bacterium]